MNLLRFHNILYPFSFNDLSEDLEDVEDEQVIQCITESEII